MNQPEDHAVPPKPRRAEPLQPDRPARGRGTQPADDAPRDDAGSTPMPAASSAQDKLSKDAAAPQRRQAKDALDNVREGYD
jgi:hypothetical protein